MKKGKFLMLGFYLAVLLALLAVVAVIFRFTNGGTDEFKTFYVEGEKHNIFATTDTASVYAGASYEYGVGYTFEKLQGQTKDYSVKVLLNTDSESYKQIKAVGDTDTHPVSELEQYDFSGLFGLEKKSGGFAFNVPYSGGAINNYFLGVLGGCYRSDFADMAAADGLFKIVVTSYNGAKEITLTLNISYATPDSVQFDNIDEPIIFGG